MGLRGIVLGAAVLAGAIAAPSVPTASAMPANDSRILPAQMFVPDPDMTGIRRKAERVGSTVIDPDFLTGGPFDDANDPPLVQPVALPGLQPFSNCPDRPSIMADAASTDWYAQRTVWYEVTKDASGAPFSQDTLVTVDTGGSTFAAALEVFKGATTPAAFNQSAPVLPTTVVACDRNPSTVVPAVVSFIAKPGVRYWLMAGIAPLPASPSNGNLRLSMRVLDIATPVVTINLDDAPDVSKVFEYTVKSKDPTALGPDLHVTQTNRSTELRKVALGAHCGDKGKPGPGQYCVNGSTVRVHWNSIKTSRKVSGALVATYTDRAGNDGTNTLRTALRDRLAPQLSANTTARWTRRGRLFVTAKCFGGPGTIEVQVGAARKSVGTTAFSRGTMRLKKAFPKVTRRTTFIHVICRDRSKNADDTWLFLPG
jgi:hypothetical protein